MNELEVLREVREAIRLDWWPGEGRRGLRVGGGDKCVVMHVTAVANLLSVRPHLPMWTLAEHLGSEDRLDLSPIARFNDTHTHAEVLALLDDVIAKLTEHESGDPLPPLPALHPELVS